MLAVVLLPAVTRTARGQVAVQTVIDSTTQLPKGAGTTNDFRYFTLGGGTVAFHASVSGNYYTYAWSGGTLSTVADFSTTAPGTAQTFNALQAPSVVDGAVVFEARSGSGTGAVSGIYRYAGGSLGREADTTMQGPSNFGLFNSFNQMRGNQAGVTFTYSTNSNLGTGVGARFGLARVSGGGYTVVADNNTVAPGAVNSGAPAPFSNIDYATTVGTTTAFLGTAPASDKSNYTNGASGVYVSRGGTLSTVAGIRTPVPGGTGTFASNYLNPAYFTKPAVSATTVAFGYNPQPSADTGIYASTGGVLSRVAGLTTTAPGTTATFFSFPTNQGSNVLRTLAVAGDTVAFLGGTSHGTGAYAWSAAGGVRRLADFNTPVPGHAGSYTFIGVQTSDAAGDYAVFLNQVSAFDTGLYAVPLDGGAVSKLVASGDVINGKTVLSVSVGGDGFFDGQQVLFNAYFTDGSTGLYLVPVPEPATVLAVAAVGLLAVRRRRV